MVDRGYIVAHRVSKSDSIYNRRPNLKGIVRVPVLKLLPVFHECRKPLSRISVFSFLKNLLYRVDEKLQRGQPLLAINDDAAFNRSRRKLHLLKDHSAHEVRFCPTVFQYRMRELFYIVPKRFPLLLLLPHVTALEGGYLVTDGLREQPLRAL